MLVIGGFDWRSGVGEGEPVLPLAFSYDIVPDGRLAPFIRRPTLRRSTTSKQRAANDGFQEECTWQYSRHSRKWSRARSASARITLLYRPMALAAEFLSKAAKFRA